MAAPTYVASGTFVHGSGALSPGLPAGWAQNDIFILVVHLRGATSGATAPSGWAHVTSSPAAHNSALESISVMWKRATASESAPSVADPGGDYASARIHAYRGAITSGNPWDVAGATTNSTFSTTFNISGVTTTVTDTRVVINEACFDTATVSGWTNANLSGLTERVDSNGGGSTFTQQALADGTKATAGATGTTTVTISISSFGIAHVMALKGTATATNANAETRTVSTAVNQPRGGVGVKAEVIG
jgi:hypothetical protein